MKLIPLTQGKYAQVDDDLFDQLNAHRWYAVHRKKHDLWYAVREVAPECDPRKNRRQFFMHWEVLGIKTQTDHADGNGLNNQRHNLRPASNHQNGANKRKPKRASGSSSRYKGVTWAKDRKMWRAMIRVNWKLIQLGQYETEEVAARTYDAAALKLFGAFARLNFPVVV